MSDRKFWGKLSPLEQASLDSFAVEKSWFNNYINSLWDAEYLLKCTYWILILIFPNVSGCHKQWPCESQFIGSEQS